MRTRFFEIVMLAPLFMLLSCAKETRYFESLLMAECPQKGDTVVVDLLKLPFEWDSMFYFSGRFSKHEIEQTIMMSLDKRFDTGPRVIFICDGTVVYEEVWYFTERYTNYVYLDKCMGGDYLQLTSSSSIIHACIEEKESGQYYLIWK